MTWRVYPLDDFRRVRHETVEQTSNDIVEDGRATWRPIDIGVCRRRKARRVAKEIESSQHESSAKPISRIPADDASDKGQGHDRIGRSVGISVGEMEAGLAGEKP